MARIVIGAEHVQIELSLTDELLSLHGAFKIAFVHIRSATADPVPAALFRGFRVGTNLPGVKVAGTFLASDGASYYDFHDPTRCVTLELEHDRYRRVVVEVDPGEDAAEVAAAIQARLGG